jgi:uncharacterized repeat protein (TIGR01451 family)
VFRVGPPRKFSWWFRGTADLDWLIGAETPLQESQNAGSPHLVLTLSADRTEARPGDEITYTLKYRNPTSMDAGNVRLRVPLYLTFLSGRNEAQVGGITGGGKETSNDILWSLGDLPGRTSGSVSFRLRVRGYPAVPTAAAPIAPILTRPIAYYCRPSHSAPGGCMPLTVEGGTGSYCCSTLGNLVATERPPD